MKDIIKTKGGNNATALVGTIDFEKLRVFQLKEYNLQNAYQKNDLYILGIAVKFFPLCLLTFFYGIDMITKGSVEI